MSAIASDTRTVSAGEPKPIIPPLALFYWHARDLSWLIVRLTAGGMLLVPGVIKGVPLGGEGFSPPLPALPPPPGASRRAHTCTPLTSHTPLSSPPPRRSPHRTRPPSRPAGRTRSSRRSLCFIGIPATYRGLPSASRGVKCCWSRGS